MKTLLPPRRLCLAGLSAFALLLGAAAPAQALVQTFTSAATFQADLQPGYYQESFTSYSGQNMPSPQSFSGGNGFTFTLSDNDSSGIFYSTGTGAQGSVFASVNLANESFTLSFGSGVTAVGGNFFLSSQAFAPLAGGNVTATLADGTSLVLASSATYANEPFGGFASTTPITSLTLSGPAGSLTQFVSLDNLYVGQAVSVVPEPSAWAMMVAGAGLGGFVVLRRRSAQRA